MKIDSRILYKSLMKSYYTKSDAQYIVSCVNACEGINPKAVPVLLETLGTIACIGTALGSERRANEKLLQVMEFAQEAIQESILKAEEK